MDLSVIILNYNSGDYLKKCLKSITKSKLPDYHFEVIIVDNNSTDKSILYSQEIKSNNFKYLLLKDNRGFAHGNNQGLKKINPKSKHVLFLNPDTLVQENTFKVLLDFFKENSNVDAATCQINLAINGQMQPECHRGFPTPWNAFSYFSGLSKIFPKSKLFSGYFLGHLDTTKIHQIDACVGAFLMLKKEVGDKIGWWNEKYFFYGEDLDFCYQLKQHGFNLFFNPHCKIIHFQGISSGIINQSKQFTQASRETKIRAAKASTQAMRTFYQLNLFSKYPKVLRGLVLLGIKLLEIKRVIKAKYL